MSKGDRLRFGVVDNALFRSALLPSREVLRKPQKQLSVRLFHPRQAATQLVQVACILTVTTPGVVISVDSFLRRFIAVVQNLRTSHLLKSFQSGNGVAVLDSRNVAAEQLFSSRCHLEIVSFAHAESANAHQRSS